MITETKEITNSDDYIDVRDVIARVEELEGEITDEIEGDDRVDDYGNVIVDTVTCGVCGFEWNDARISSVTPAPGGRCPVEYEHEQRAELKMLTELLEELEGNGGDEQWRGSWYPVTLIRESYFKDYAEELAEDIGAINSEASWPNNHIDWDAAADELLGDYTSTEFEGVTYYYR